MLILASTSDLLRLVTDSAATVDCFASWVDRNAGTDTPGNTPTAISSATTTTIVAAPAASTVRNVRSLLVRNKHATLTVTVTVQIYNGTAYELEKRVLGPGQSLQFVEGAGFFAPNSGGSGLDPWAGQIVGCMNRGDPGLLMRQLQCGGNVAATPTNISTSVARCSLFSLPFDMTVNRIRCYGVGATTGIYQVAIYRYSGLARLTSQIAITTAASTWANPATSLGLALTAGVDYFIACSVNATGTTAGIGCAGGTVAATTGQVATTPDGLPGSLAVSGGYFCGYFFQFACTTGALPTTAPTLAAQAAWTGGMPAFFLDAADV